MRARAIVGVTAATAALVACGASSSGGHGADAGNAGGGDAGGPAEGDGAGIGSGTGCPSSVPAAGSACAPSGLSCEYGDDPNPQCNTIVTCQGGAGWSAPPGSSACTPGTCPATYAGVPQGKDCSPQGLDCAYPQGQCNCAPTVPASGPNPVWQCSTPASGCPEPRPREGSACASPGLTCDYGACTGGVSLECSDGYWRVAQTACPA